MKHELKTWPESYNAIVKGLRKFEVRKNDRDFKVGDKLLLREFIPCKECNGTGRVQDYTDWISCGCIMPHGKYSGNNRLVSVDYILQGKEFGIMDGYCIMSITKTK